MEKKRIGVLTAGGDVPGWNDTIATITEESIALGFEVIGIYDGWKGIRDIWEHSKKEGELLRLLVRPLTLEDVRGIRGRGGTILYTIRANPTDEELQGIVENLRTLNIYALFVIGGNDNLGVADKLGKLGVNVIGIPKTIDNDISGTEESIGFHTAVSKVATIIRDLHTTAQAHHRVFVVETMGRDTGWIVYEAGKRGGAEFILVPEIFDDVMSVVDEELRKKEALVKLETEINQICETIEAREKQGKLFSIIVVGEGLEEVFAAAGLAAEIKEKDVFGHVQYSVGKSAAILAKILQKRTGFEARIAVPGHTQRSGDPVGPDIDLATDFGMKAIELLKEERFGRMVAKVSGEIIDVPLEASSVTRRISVEKVREYNKSKSRG